MGTSELNVRFSSLTSSKIVKNEKKHWYTLSRKNNLETKSRNSFFIPPTVLSNTAKPPVIPNRFIFSRNIHCFDWISITFNCIFLPETFPRVVNACPTTPRKCIHPIRNMAATLRRSPWNHIDCSIMLTMQNYNASAHKSNDGAGQYTTLSEVCHSLTLTHTDKQRGIQSLWIYVA